VPCTALWRCEQVKSLIRNRIRSGEWPPDHRVPSEGQLVEAHGVSKMTADRALRELSDEGLVVRVRGRGTFVAKGGSRPATPDILDVAKEIHLRGHRHNVEVVSMCERVPERETAWQLDLAEGVPAFYSLIVHRADAVPWRLEEWIVRRDLAPAYMSLDFKGMMPHAYLASVLPGAEFDCTVEAVIPHAWERKLLLCSAPSPCLLVRGRMAASGRAISTVRVIGTERLIDRWPPSRIGDHRPS